jgi:hypothetical protein
MGNWQALAGRVTLLPAIPTGGEAPLALDFYRRVWGSDPDIFQKQTSSLVSAPSIAQGTYKGLVVGCISQPLRIDLSIGPPSKQDISLIDDTKLFYEALALIVDKVTKDDDLPTINRAACFAQFSRKSKDYQEANALLSDTFPEEYEVHLTNEEDFILQINRPQMIGNTKMNHITRWSVDRMQVITLQQIQPPQTTQVSALTQLLSEHIIQQIAFDNSNATKGIMSKEDVRSVLNSSFQFISEQVRMTNLDVEGF